MDFNAMAFAQPFDGECRVYLETSNAMRQPIWTFPERAEGLRSFSSLAKQFAATNQMSLKLVDAATALVFDPNEDEASAILYLEVAPDRRRHTGDLRINRQQTPRRPVQPQAKPDAPDAGAA